MASSWFPPQLAMPFGAVAAVYAWDRLGEASTAILRKVFLFPASNYVDDLFMPSWAQCAEESRLMLIDIIAHFGAILSEDKTPAPAASMTVLGVLVTVHHDTVVLTIEKTRLAFWRSELL
eukprot:14931839-Heterocapsa_arctica.AAC.1